MGNKKRNSGNRTRAGLPSAVVDAKLKELPELPAAADSVPPSASPDGSAVGPEMLADACNGVEADGVAGAGCILDTHEAELGTGVQSTPLAIVAKSNHGVKNGMILGSAKSGNPIYENGGEALDGNEEGPHGDASSVKTDYEKALLAFRRGNHNKALRLMKECCAQHENFALSHRLQGNICMKIASLIEDPGLKQRHMKTAIESARKAVLLSPQSIEFAHYYAQLLYEASNDSKDYEEVVKECERALSIENPVDPVKDSLQDESQLKPTPHARISDVQQELRTLVQKSNIASISSWMKNLGNGTGEEKFRLIQMRRLPEDPLEVRMSQSRRPHEIKKNIKTPEERRKEIEVRVAAARLLQHRNDVPLTSSDQRSNQFASGNNRGERRKGATARKLSNAVSMEDKMEQVKPFWHSVDMQKRQEMLEIPVEDLKSHWISSKDSTILDILSEALSFAHAKKTWRFWVCCKCNEKFADKEAFMQHVVRQHVESLSPKLQSVIPQEVDNNWADQLLNGDCRPIDAHAAVKILLRSKCDIKNNIPMTEQLPSVSSAPDSTVSSCLDNCSENFVDCADKSSDDVAAMGKDGSKLLEESQSHTFNNIEFAREARHSDPVIDTSTECSNHKSVVGDNLVEPWPLDDDIERGKLLERIYSLFRSLIKHKCLAASHLSKVVQYAADELQIFVPESSMQCEIKQSPVYIRFLQAHQLRNIVKYLRELAHACGLDRYSDKTTMSNGTEDYQEDEVQERLILTDDFANIVLDERLLKNIDNRSNLGECSSIAVSHLTRFSLKEWQDRIPLIDLQLVWVFGTSCYDLQPPAWTKLREEKSQQGIEVLQTLDKEFYHLQSLCDRKCEHVSYEEALNTAERLCLEELKKREQSGKVASQSYEALLKKRQEELDEGHNDSLLSHCKFELGAITNILKEAQSLPRFGYDESSTPASSCLTGLDYVEDDEWRMQYLHQTDSFIEVAIQRLKDQLSTEVSKLDAKIMRNVFGMQQLEVKLGLLASFDYRVVILPLIKSYLKSRLEDAAEKDATEKSDAAREAFLAELARDAKSNDEKGSDQPKHPHEKSKDKKKNKDQRKAKDSKGSINGGQQPILKGNIGGCIIDDDKQDKTGIKKCTTVEELKKKEEDELKWQVELEAEERKLEETLEYQRRIEEEAKQKHLAELSKKQVEENKLSMPKESESIIVGTEPHLDLLETSSLMNGCLSSSTLQDTNSVLSEKKMFSTWSYPEEVSTCTEKRDICAEDSKSYFRRQDKRAHSAKDRSYHGSVGFQNHNSARTVGHVDKGSLVDDKRRLTKIQMGHKYSGETVYSGSMTSSVNNQERQRFQDPEPHSCSRSVADGSLQLTERDSSSSFGQKTRGQKTRGQRTRQKVSMQIADRGTCAYIPKIPPKHDISQVPDSSFENSVIEIQDVNGHVPLTLSVTNKHGTSNNEMKMRTITGLKQGATFSEKVISVPVENSSKTLRQLHAEEDDEERFQADLDLAVRQSLDTYNAKHSSLLFCDATKIEGGYPITDGSILPTSGLPSKTVTEVDNFGKGLQNEVGEYNCFLNVIIQSLWHLRRFREEFLVLSSSQHVHIGEPCVVCALYNIFVALSTATTEATMEAVAPTSLRIALSMLYPESKFFQQAQMNDASEVLEVIFGCLHQAFTSNGSASDTESDGSLYIGSWDCQNQTCIAHRLFGLNISEQMNCKSCGLESRHLKYTSFFHNINASALRTMKIMCMESSLDELLNLVEMNDQLACDTEVGGCGHSNYIHHLLAAAPYVFTTVLGWQNNCENVEDITATLDAITTEIDVGVIYRGLDEGYMHRLISVVCYYGQHYHCFAYSSEHTRWVMYDDTTVKVVGGWDDVTDTCRRGHLQPQVLFYEAVE